MEDLTPDIPTEALEAAARALADSHDPPWVDSAWDNPPVPASVVESWRNGFRNLARDALAAAAPHLIAEGRKQAAEAIRAEGPRVTEVKFWFVHGEERYESGAEWAARIAEGTNPREETTP